MDDREAVRVPAFMGQCLACLLPAVPAVTLTTFNGNNGAGPSGTVTLSNSTLYGMTPGGGAYSASNVVQPSLRSLAVINTQHAPVLLPRSARL